MGSFFGADCLTHEKRKNLTPSKFTNYAVCQSTFSRIIDERKIAKGRNLS